MGRRVVIQDNINIVRDFYNAIARGDFAKHMLDPQIEWIEPHVLDLWFGGLHQGQDAVLKEVLEPTFEKFDAFRIECDDYFDAGSHIIVTGHYLGREKQSGRELNASFAHIWRLQEGKAIWFKSYTDTASWLHTLGYFQLEHATGMHT
jgi:ketosteroid isomerase-like protein